MNTPCEFCGETEAVTNACRHHDQHGRRRAQIVLTVANLDTGQAASANIVPGAVEPVRSPAGRWLLPLGPILTDLATQAGVAPDTLYDPGRPSQAARIDTEEVLLPWDWRPDLPAGQRHALEAVALAGKLTMTWHVLLGCADAPAPPDHNRLLDRLCAVADELRLDLVIEARSASFRTGLTWDIRFEVPNSGVPLRPQQTCVDLPAAVAATSIEQAVTGLDQARPDTPAHYFELAYNTHTMFGGARLISAQDVDLLERRITRDCVGTLGAQAIWRDRHWWHTTLQPDQPAERLQQRETGQADGRITPLLRRGWEPPAPEDQGEAIPTTPCGGCRATGTGGDGRLCPHCQGDGRLHHGAVLTISDLNGRFIHLNWRPDDAELPTTLVATRATGVSVLQLPEHYQVRLWADTLDVRPEDLTSLHGERTIGQYLRHGVVHLAEPSTDPVRTYVTKAAAGRPGARILLRANDWSGPCLADLARLVLGLGLGIEVTVINHRLNASDPHLAHGIHWGVSIVDPDTPIGQHADANQHSVGEAVAYCLRHFSGAVRGTVSPDLDRPIRIPQQPKPVTHDLLDLPNAPGITVPIRRLAAGYPGRPAIARLDTTGYRTTISG